MQINKHYINKIAKKICKIFTKFGKFEKKM